MVEIPTAYIAEAQAFLDAEGAGKTYDPWADDDGDGIIDYKFHCINGQIAGILVCYDRKPQLHEGNFDYYDPDWNLTDGILPQFQLCDHLQ